MGSLAWIKPSKGTGFCLWSYGVLKWFPALSCESWATLFQWGVSSGTFDKKLAIPCISRLFCKEFDTKGPIPSLPGDCAFGVQLSCRRGSQLPCPHSAYFWAPGPRDGWGLEGEEKHFVVFVPVAVFSSLRFSGLKLSLCLVVLSRGLEHLGGWPVVSWGLAASPSWGRQAPVERDCMKSSGEGAWGGSVHLHTHAGASDIFTSLMGFNRVSLNDFHVYVSIHMCLHRFNCQQNL